MARQWIRETDPQLKAKLALLIIRDATTGEVNPAELQRRALENYFLRSEEKAAALTFTRDQGAPTNVPTGNCSPAGLLRAIMEIAPLPLTSRSPSTSPSKIEATLLEDLPIDNSTLPGALMPTKRAATLTVSPQMSN